MTEPFTLPELKIEDLKNASKHSPMGFSLRVAEPKDKFRLRPYSATCRKRYQTNATSFIPKGLLPFFAKSATRDIGELHQLQCYRSFLMSHNLVGKFSGDIENKRVYYYLQPSKDNSGFLVYTQTKPLNLYHKSKKRKRQTENELRKQEFLLSMLDGLIPNSTADRECEAKEPKYQTLKNSSPYLKRPRYQISRVRKPLEKEESSSNDSEQSGDRKIHAQPTSLRGSKKSAIDPYKGTTSSGTIWCWSPEVPHLEQGSWSPVRGEHGEN